MTGPVFVDTNVFVYGQATNGPVGHTHHRWGTLRGRYRFVLESGSPVSRSP